MLNYLLKQYFQTLSEKLIFISNERTNATQMNFNQFIFCSFPVQKQSFVTKHKKFKDVLWNGGLNFLKAFIYKKHRETIKGCGGLGMRKF